MEVTITIDPALVRMVSDTVLEMYGERPTEQKLKEFFREDVMAIYERAEDGGLDDAIESFFYVEA